MTSRRPIVNVGGLPTEIATTDNLAFGMETALSREVDTANGLTAKTLTKRYTFLTGTAALSFDITLPAASAAIDGQIMTLTSTNGRALVTWTSSGASTAGLPGINANQSVSVQYIHSITRWISC
jgi:hypothetical protein